jgi:predicted DNA-binding mobile mystery protein A
MRQITRHLDEDLRVFKNAPPSPSVGWVRTIREALGMTYSQFAKRLGIARPSVYALESDEVSGVASLDRLNRAAAALDCKLVYALVPNNSLEETVKRQAFSKAKKRLGRVNVSQTLEESGLSEDAFFEQVHDLAIELMVERPNTLWDD